MLELVKVDDKEPMKSRTIAQLRHLLSKEAPRFAKLKTSSSVLISIMRRNECKKLTPRR